jgi:putative flippase GtrA
VTTHLALWRRFSRYTIGSIICFAISEAAFVGLFASQLLGARGASAVASIIGIIPGYALNRTWTWGRRERSQFWREVVPYWVTALSSTVIAALATGAVNGAFADEPRTTRTAVNAAAYMLTYGVLFVVKFLIFHRWVFAPEPAEASGSVDREAVSA